MGKVLGKVAFLVLPDFQKSSGRIRVLLFCICFVNFQYGSIAVASKKEPSKQESSFSSYISRRGCLLTILGVGAAGTTGLFLNQSTRDTLVNSKKEELKRVVDRLVSAVPPPLRGSARQRLYAAMEPLDEKKLTYERQLIETHMEKMRLIRESDPLADDFFLKMSKEALEGPISRLGASHIGLNMILDPDSLEKVVGSEGTQILKNAKRDPVAAAKVIQKLLHKHKNQASALGGPEDSELPIDVALIISGGKPFNTECRHYSLILNSTLSHYGYQGKIGRGWLREFDSSAKSGNHAWFEIPESRLIFDAQNFPEPISKEEFVGKYIAAYIDDKKIIRTK